MTMTDEQKDLLRLCARSKKDEKGWSNVSNILWSYVQQYSKDCELFELEEHRIRISEKGQIVLKYLF